MPDPGGNIYSFPGHGGPQFFVPLHTYINIPPWFSKQNSHSRLAAAGSTWLRLCEPCLEHIDNNFKPLDTIQKGEFSATASTPS